MSDVRPVAKAMTAYHYFMKYEMTGSRDDLERAKKKCEEGLAIESDNPQCDELYREILRELER